MPLIVTTTVSKQFAPTVAGDESQLRVPHAGIAVHGTHASAAVPGGGGGGGGGGGAAGIGFVPGFCHQLSPDELMRLATVS